MNYYFTSDLHFGHSKDFLWGPRGFKNSQEHDEMLIYNWNNLITPDDTVFILGDLMLENNEAGIKKLKRLMGQKIIILGNHDTPARIHLYRQEGYSTYHAYQIKLNKWNWFLCHYPTVTTNYDDKDKPLRTRIHALSGHTHSRELFDPITGSYNVALDAHHMMPVSITQIQQDIIKRFRKDLS